MNNSAEALFKNAGFIVFEPKDEYKKVFLRIELRWKCQLIMPPSLSRYGYNYKFINGIPKSDPAIVSSNMLISALKDFGYNTALDYQDIALLPIYLSCDQYSYQKRQ
ncbi:hypothetical protein FACS189441_8380 [Betaproteobacteria bacterium]|nr:hypothetical protein FACS189441_8380 [Betaproteobacteria bacterium]